jgi:hypothetical protein
LIRRLALSSDNPSNETSASGQPAADNPPKSGARDDPKTRDEDEGCVDNGRGKDLDCDGRS